MCYVCLIQGIRGLTLVIQMQALIDYASIIIGIIWLNWHNFLPFFKSSTVSMVSIFLVLFSSLFFFFFFEGNITRVIACLSLQNFLFSSSAHGSFYFQLFNFLGEGDYWNVESFFVQRTGHAGGKECVCPSSRFNKPQTCTSKRKVMLTSYILTL